MEKYSDEKLQDIKGKVIQLYSSVGRNDPCPCGSGKKYKKCCLPKQDEEKQLQRRHEETKTVSDKYFSVKEYISVAGYPVVNFDYFLLELLNITGGILHTHRKLSTEKTKELFRKITMESKSFFSSCSKCEVGCLKEPMKRINLKSLIDKNIRVEEFPLPLQKPVSINFFYFEFFNVFISTLWKELSEALSENEAEDIVSTVHTSIFDFVSDNCWGDCRNKCISQYDKNAYCSLCSFGEDTLPCPKNGDISYEEIFATEEDMTH